MNTLFESEGWAYKTYEPEFSGNEEFITLWQARKDGRFLPAWEDFEFEDFTSWWGNIMVLDYLKDPFDFRFRLWGQNMVIRYQREATNSLGSEMVAQGKMHQMDIDYYQYIAEHAKIGYSTGPFVWQGREHITTAFLDLPLSSDGKTVTNCLSLMI